MKLKLASVLVSILATSLILSAYQPSSAVPYYGHDGSVDTNVEKVKVSPYKGKKDLWIYIVKACGTTHNLAVASVILKSDLEKIPLGVNSYVGKGKCGYYGAVMKAKNPDTMGAELIEKHEALDRLFELQNQLPKMTKSQKTDTMSEIAYLKSIMGIR